MWYYPFINVAGKGIAFNIPKGTYKMAVYLVESLDAIELL